MLSQLIAAAVLTTGLPAPACVSYDPDAKTGFVRRRVVLTAFEWSADTLAERAAGLVFNHEFRTADTYTVTCGGPAFPVVHHREYGRFELTAHAGSGYGGLAGFRLTGAHAGISGTSVPPSPGRPCPDNSGKTIDRATLASTATGWTLTVTSDGVRRELPVC